jgi:cytochrome c peroxidase
MSKRILTYLVAMASLALAIGLITPGPVSGSETDVLTPMEQLGKHLFFDQNLSTPAGQACASCHAPETGFTGPNSAVNEATGAYPGAVHTRFGNRKPPGAAYAGDSPVLYLDEEEGIFVGGMFWDARATGWELGDPLAEQARGPFLNPLEQNTPGKHQLVLKVALSDYAHLYEVVFGPLPKSRQPSMASVGGPSAFLKNVDEVYDNLALSIAAYERSVEVNPFTSKFDYFMAGMVELTPLEAWGMELFEGDAQCAACHPAPLFTDFTYDNLGLPRNLDNPFYDMPRKWNPDGGAWIDPGLGGFLATVPAWAHLAEENLGKHKVPTLRNIDLRPTPDFVKAFGHNGVFKSLEEIVHFYNTRDVLPWPEPEVPINVNTDELGDLGLTPEEEEAIIAFLKTLSDGFVP